LEENLVYAIVETGGKQYKVAPGQTVDVEKLPGEPGETVELDRVLMVAEDDNVAVGQPVVSGAKVIATVVNQVKGEKLIVFKYKNKTRYRRKTGHRQEYTRLAVKEIATS
jgi:large subunit ribosomal protein L21